MFIFKVTIVLSVSLKYSVVILRETSTDNLANPLFIVLNPFPQHFYIECYVKH